MIARNRLVTRLQAVARRTPDYTVGGAVAGVWLDDIDAVEAEVRATERALVEDHRPEIAVDTDDSTWLDCSCDNWERNSPLDWWQHIWAAVDKRLAKNDQAGTKPSMRR